MSFDRIALNRRALLKGTSAAAAASMTARRMPIGRNSCRSMISSMSIKVTLNQPISFR